MTSNDKGTSPGPLTDTHTIPNTRSDLSGAGPPTASALLQRPGACLTRSHLRELGHGRRSVDAIMRSCPVVILPGYSRPMITVAAYLDLLDRSTVSGVR